MIISGKFAKFYFFVLKIANLIAFIASRKYEMKPPIENV
jgi:hypothetical protein